MSRIKCKELLGPATHFAFLAPLAGYSDLPFRQICHRNGSQLGTTELVSAAGIRYSGLKSSWRYLAIDPAKEGAVLIQLFGSAEEDFVYAAEAVLDHPVLSQCIGIDINMGCPVPKVVKTGAGSALMKTPALAISITRRLAALAHERGKILSCKIRRGFVMNEETAPSLAVGLVEAGCDLLTIHGRYRDQYYSGQADWGVTHRTHDLLVDKGLRDNVFLVANGDIVDLESGQACLATTLADGVAIGRAAQGNPWVFREDSVSVTEKAATIREHAELLSEFVGEGTAMREFRKTLASYAQGHPRAKKLRTAGTQIESLADVYTWLEAYVSHEVTDK